MTVSQDTPKASDTPAIQAREQQQRGAQEIEARLQARAHRAADDAAGGLRAARPGCQCRRREPAAGHQQQHEAGHAAPRC